MRTSRAGFIQKRVLSLLGIFPWKCGACGSAFLAANRGGRERRKGEGSDRRGDRRPVETAESHQA